jgi:hypothetical protein
VKNILSTELTPEEQQYINDEAWKYAAYSSTINVSDLLAKVTQQFERTPSYVERFKDGREQFDETDISCQPLIQQVNHIFVIKE